MEWYDVGSPVFSGHNGWADWGPPPEGSGPVLVIGLEQPTRLFEGCAAAGRSTTRGGGQRGAGRQDLGLRRAARVVGGAVAGLLHLDA